MPIPGTLELATLGALPVLESFDTEPLALPESQVLQVFYELDAPGWGADLLPPALHASVPALVNVLALVCAQSDIGPVTIAQVRVFSRSGMVIRNHQIASVVNEPDAAAQLSARWGFRCLPGEVTLRRHYDSVELQVTRDGTPILVGGLTDPQPLAPEDLSYAAQTHLAKTPRGPRLVHVAVESVIRSCDRGTPVLSLLDGAAWGEPRLDAVYPVSATIAVVDVTLPALKQLSVPDVDGPAGNETVDG